MSDNISEIDTHITKKYEIKKRLGKGAYGIVWKAINRKSGEVVAVKKIFDAFRNQTDAQRTFREIMFLQEFGNHPNVIKLLDVLRADNDRDIYLVFEFMETDLHNVIKRGNILKDIHKRYIMYQLFKATKYLHSGNVVHRDQKPSNILLDADCFVKIADFGLARSLSQIERDDHGDPALTEYVATRWYRAPEILLASKRYTKGIDTWSLGCILGEMIVGKPLFPGTSTLNQIEKIMAAIQPPSKTDIESICSGYAMSLMERANSRARYPLKDMIPAVSEDALDLLNKLLVFNPDRRLTAEQALKHPYVARFHNASEEPGLTYDVLPPLSDSVQLTVDEYRNKLYEMIQERKLRDKHRRQERNANREAKANRPPSAKGDNPPKGDIVKSESSGRSHERHKSTSHTTAHSKNSAASGHSRAMSAGRLKTYDSASHTTVNNSPPSDNGCSRSHRHLSAPPAGLPSGSSKAASATANAATAAACTRNNSVVVVRDYRSSSKASPSPQKSSASNSRDNKPKPVYGKKQYGNYSNVPSVGAPRTVLHSYSQAHGTITASALSDLRQCK